MAVRLKMAPTCKEKKHDCPDCRFCQFCSDTRCNACRDGQRRPPRLTIAEQIALFESINHDDPVRPDRPLRIRNDRPGPHTESG